MFPLLHCIFTLHVSHVCLSRGTKQIPHITCTLSGLWQLHYMHSIKEHLKQIFTLLHYTFTFLHYTHTPCRNTLSKSDLSRLHFSTLYHTTCITTVGDQTVTLLDCYCSHTYQLQEHLNHTFILLVPHCTFYIICIPTTEHLNQTLTLPYVYQLQEHCNQTYTLLNYTLTKLWLAFSVYTNHSNNLTKLWLLTYSVYTNHSNNLTKLWLLMYSVDTNYSNNLTKLWLLTYSVDTNHSNNLTKLWLLTYSVDTNHSNNLTKLWLWRILWTPTTATTTWPNSDSDSWRILWTPTTATTWPNSDSDVFCGHQLQQQQLDQTLTLTYSVDTNYSNNNLTKLWLWRILWTPTTATTTWPNSDSDIFCGHQLHQHTGTSNERQQAFSQVCPAFCLNHYRTQHHDVDGSVFGWGWAAAAALTRICSLDQASVTSLMSSSLQQTPHPSAMILTNLPLPQFSNCQKVVRWLQNPRCLWTTYKSAFWHAMEHEPHSALLQSRALCSQWHPRTSGAWMLYPLPSLKMLTTVSAPPQRQHCTGHVCIHWHTVQ